MGLINDDNSPVAVMVGCSYKTEKLKNLGFTKIEVNAGDEKVFLYERKDQQVYLVLRHHCDCSRRYCPPHFVPFPLIAVCLKMKGVQRVLSICSVGTLKPELAVPGDLVVIDDYFSPFKTLSYFCPPLRGMNDEAFANADEKTLSKCHFVPNLAKSKFRILILSILKSLIAKLPASDGNQRKRSLIDGATYANAQGPRFETPSEIRFYKDYADVIGMTAALESDCLWEQNIDVAVVCVVDNFANGISVVVDDDDDDDDDEAYNNQLTEDLYYKGVRGNESAVELLIKTIFEHF